MHEICTLEVEMCRVARRAMFGRVIGVEHLGQFDIEHWGHLVGWWRVTRMKADE